MPDLYVDGSTVKTVLTQRHDCDRKPPMQRSNNEFKKSQDRKVLGIFLPSNMTVAGCLEGIFFN